MCADIPRRSTHPTHAYSKLFGMLCAYVRGVCCGRSCMVFLTPALLLVIAAGVWGCLLGRLENVSVSFTMPRRDIASGSVPFTAPRHSRWGSVHRAAPRHDKVGDGWKGEVSDTWSTDAAQPSGVYIHVREEQTRKGNTYRK